MRCFSLVMWKFCSNSALVFMFIFLLTPFETWDCYYFESNVSLVLLIKVLLIKSDMLPLFSGPELLCCFWESKCLLKNWNLGDSGISLPAFPSRINLKLHNSKVTPKLIKVTTNLDSPKTSDNRLVDHLKKCGLFPISSIVLGLLDQLQIYW